MVQQILFSSSRISEIQNNNRYAYNYNKIQDSREIKQTLESSAVWDASLQRAQVNNIHFDERNVDVYPISARKVTSTPHHCKLKSKYRKIIKIHCIFGLRILRNMGIDASESR